MRWKWTIPTLETCNGNRLFPLAQKKLEFAGPRPSEQNEHCNHHLEAGDSAQPTKYKGLNGPSIARGLTDSLFFPSLGPLLVVSFLQNVLGAFELFPLSHRKRLAGPIDKELNHSNPRTDPLGTDPLTGHCAGDRLGVFLEKPLWRKGRYRFDLGRPFAGPRP